MDGLLLGTMIFTASCAFKSLHHTRIAHACVASGGAFSLLQAVFRLLFFNKDAFLLHMLPCCAENHMILSKGDLFGEVESP